MVATDISLETQPEKKLECRIHGSYFLFNEGREIKIIGGSMAISSSSTNDCGPSVCIARRY